MATVLVGLQSRLPREPPGMAAATRHTPAWGPCASCRVQLPASSSSACPKLEGSAKSRRLSLDEVDCTERYVSVVRCAGKTFMFSRVEHYPHPTPREPEPEPLYSWIVRLKQPAGAYSEAIAASSPAVQKMGVNAALVCEHGQLVALGGENRVTRSVANASNYPLRWSSPTLAFTGDKRTTGCVEERPREGCEYDGKISSVKLHGRTLVFTRSNLNSAGGRHVQMASSADGHGSWARFQQLTFSGYTTRAHNNIYFFSARAVPLPLTGTRHDRLLLATFPAAIEGLGGVYCSVSFDGVHWAAPRRVMESKVLPAWRTTDHPVDGESSSRGREEGKVSVVLEHNVAIPTDAESDERPFVRAQDYCRASALPTFCSHTFAWRARRVNSTHIHVRLGEHAPWVVAMPRSGDRDAIQ